MVSQQPEDTLISNKANARRNFNIAINGLIKMAGQK